MIILSDCAYHLWVLCKPWTEQAGGWIPFCIKRLRTLNSYQIFKIKNLKLKTYSGCCPFKGLSNDTTLRQIQSGRTVPLTHQKRQDILGLIILLISPMPQLRSLDIWGGGGCYVQVNGNSQKFGQITQKKAKKSLRLDKFTAEFLARFIQRSYLERAVKEPNFLKVLFSSLCLILLRTGESCSHSNPNFFTEKMVTTHNWFNCVKNEKCYVN